MRTRAIKAAEKGKNFYLKGYAYRTLGDIDLKHQAYERQPWYKFQRPVSMADQIGNKFLKISTMHRIGRTYFLLNDPDTALKYLLEDIELARKYGYSDELEVALKNYR